ncbi:hypothetical protein FH972_022080 [Carpinus fangiana]|uniref:Zinc finger PHD-type domain-containing protein n=1 Tax=Carpinus fangiana TaxID=176857 RepID=A0A5N6KRU4_9ROSI|nr:hypothetical protein FH972_022080 [Carpinus fangiana]
MRHDEVNRLLCKIWAMNFNMTTVAHRPFESEKVLAALREAPAHTRRIFKAIYPLIVILPLPSFLRQQLDKACGRSRVPTKPIMPSRKRGHDEVDHSEMAGEPSLLQRVRNSWQFASLMQYIQIFGDAAKIPEKVDVDMLEEECLKVPHSEELTEIGLCMLRMVSSHRGLTPEIFDEYTRRQYVAKAPHRNPFGEEEMPHRFADMDIIARLDVLCQLSVWTFFNEDRMRDRMAEKDTSEQAMSWRSHPVGWDAQEREYYVLDDNRLYRMTRPSLPPPPKAKPKAKPKPKKAIPPKPRGSRSSKRQKVLNGEDDDENETTIEIKDDEEQEDAETELIEPEDNGLGGSKWELLAITLEEYRAVMDPFRKSRDPDEKALYKFLEQESLPALERAAASSARKAAQRQRELEALAKMANAKRSSRISSRQQQLKEAEEALAAEHKKKEELAEAHRELERQTKMEAERESRMMTREQRIKDREMKRILQEEVLEQLRAGSEQSEGQEGRMSERNRKAKLEKSQKELDELLEEDENWDFDCAVCGVHGKNLDDGTHSVACEKCGVWQHSACHGISEEKAESDDFHFVCAACSKPKPKPKVKQEDKPAPLPVNGHAPEQGKAVQTAPVKAVFQPTRALENGQQQMRPQHSGTQVPQQQPTYYPQPPPPYHVNGHSHHNGISPAPQYPPHSFQQPYAAPSWQPPSSPSKPITPHHTHHNHIDRTYPQPPQQQLRQTPTSQRSPSFEHAAAGSPTPSLSATQGNTNVRFSPTQPQSGSFTGSLAYTPVSNKPSAAAYSPTKKIGSSPPQPQIARLNSPLTSTTGTNPSPYALNAGSFAAGRPPSSQASVIPDAAAGVSPVKHDVASSPAAPASSSSHQTGLGISSYPLAAPSHPPGGSPANSFAGAGSMGTAPTLSPNVNAGATNLNPPVKKASPSLPSISAILPSLPASSPNAPLPQTSNGQHNNGPRP